MATTVYAPGVFDLFHIGHLRYLMAAAREGDHLVVGVQDERSAEAQKGVEIITPLAHRMALIEQFRFVHDVVSYVEIFQGDLLKALAIDVFACGSTYGPDLGHPDQKRTLDYCREHGIRIAKIPTTPDVSSTRLRAQVRQFWDARGCCAWRQPHSLTMLGSFAGNPDMAEAETAREVELVLASCTATRESRLLDVACGDARLLAPLARHFGRAVGVDFSATLLALARQRIDALGDSACPVEFAHSDVTDFAPDEVFEAIVLSGILPCLDDQQVRYLLLRLGDWAAPGCKLFVRSSMAFGKRIDVVSQYSRELRGRYTAYYRTLEETRSSFARAGWQQVDERKLYQHREDTAVYWFVFRRGSPP